MTDTTLLNELRVLAIRRLTPVLGQVLEKTDDALFDVWQQGHSGQQALFDVLRELRRQRSVVESSVAERVGKAFVELAQSKRLPAQGDGQALQEVTMEFSLIDADVLEEQLTCERLAASVERRHGEMLDRLGRALTRVASIAELPMKEHPLSPLRIAAAWRDALEPIMDMIEWRLVAFKHLERGLIADLGGVIEDLMRLLQSRGVSVQAQPMRVRRPAAPPPPRAPAESGPDEGGGGLGWETVQPVNTHRLDGSGPMSTEGMPGGWAPAAGDGQDPIYLAMREMFAAYVGEQRNKQSGSVPSAASAESENAAPILASDEAIVVLSRLQRQPTPTLLAAVDDRKAEFGDLLRTELLRTAVSLGRAPVGVRLTPHDDQAVTMVGMLFDTLLDQGHFGREVRERLVRLYVPYAKIAMLDRRMFAHKQHPARRLLNQLAEACDGNTGDAPAERELLTKVFELSERLIDSFEEDTAVFTEAEAEFGGFLTRHKRRVSLAEQRAAEAQRGRERLEEARLEATLELDSLVGKRQVPKPLGDFLRRDWTHHLTMVALRDGVDSDAFREARAPGVKLWLALLACEAGGEPPSGLSDELLPAMRSAGHPEDAARLALTEIVGALYAVRPRPPAPVARPAPEPVAMVREVATTADAPVRQRSVPAATASVPAPVVPVPVEPLREEEPAPVLELITLSSAPESERPTSAAIEGDLKLDVDTDKALPELIDKVKKLQVGAWVEFVEADGSTQPAKLSWVSPISSRMLFVNRRGLRMCTVSAEELAALMAEGKLALREVDAAFDRAMSQVLDRLKSGVAVGSG